MSMTEEQINKFLAKEQEETESALWGDPVKFKPYLLDRIFGDGMKLIYFGTLDDRPYWWLVRVDSHAEENGVWDNFDEEEIYRAIEEECGCHEVNDDVEVNEYGYDEDGVKRIDGGYPEIESCSSAHWGLIADFAKGVDKYGCKIEI